MIDMLMQYDESCLDWILLYLKEYFRTLCTRMYNRPPFSAAVLCPVSFLGSFILHSFLKRERYKSFQLDLLR